MKTTIELPEELLSAAKVVAVQRRTTLKAMMEHALRREIGLVVHLDSSDSLLELNEHDFPVLKKSQVSVTSEQVYQLLEEEAG